MPHFNQDLLWFILIGAVAGFLADQFMRSRLNLLANVILGVLGALLGGWLAGELGLSIQGTLARLVAATLGAILLILLFRAVSRR